jgi:hypothetical protein
VAIYCLCDLCPANASLLGKTGLDDTFAPAAVRLDQDDPWGVARVIREGNIIVLNDLALHFGDLPGGVRVILQPLRSSVSNKLETRSVWTPSNLTQPAFRNPNLASKELPRAEPVGYAAWGSMGTSS